MSDEKLVPQSELMEQDWSNSYLALGCRVPGKSEAEHDWLVLSDTDLMHLADAIRRVCLVVPSKELIAIAEWAESVLVWKSRQGGKAS